MSKVIRFAHNTTDVRMVFENNRAIATIAKMENGNYRVIRLYDEVVVDCDSYNEAREKALNSSAVKVKKTKAG
jgi:hypothetical protein